MKIINLQQGTSEWHHYRRSHFNASDAPAMMGCSLYETRDELIHRLATGEEKPVSEETQRIFDEGHRREGLMRPIVEETINEDLSPVTGEEEPLPPHRRPMSASFDGLSMLHDVVWECKSLNNTIRGAKTVKDLHLCYKVQMEQQMLLSGAKRAYFTGVKFDGHELSESVSFWYQSDPELARKIEAGWDQLEKEIQAYQVKNHVEPQAAEKAAPTATGRPQYAKIPTGAGINASTSFATDAWSAGVGQTKRRPKRRKNGRPIVRRRLSGPSRQPSKPHCAI